ncbi:MAG: hypothetical protein V1789_03140 [PVC group bacterium]
MIFLVLPALMIGGTTTRGGEAGPVPTVAPEAPQGEPSLPASSPTPAVFPSPGAVVPGETLIDVTHGWMSSFMASQVFSFDNWFGDPDTLESEIDKPWLQVRLGGELKEGPEFEFKNRFWVFAPLPLLENRLGVFIGRDADDEYEDDQDYFDRENDDSDNNFTAGLRFSHARTKDWQFSTNLGLKFTIPPAVYIKPRLQYTHVTGRWLFRPIQYVYYYTDDGPGETTKLEINRYLGSRFLARSYTQSTYSNTSNGIDLSQEFNLQYLNFDIRHGTNYAVSLEWESNFHTWPSFKDNQHQLTLRYYRSIWRPWFRIGLGPRLTWKREVPGDDEHFQEYWKNATPSLILFIEILFEEGITVGESNYAPLQ